MSGQIDRAANVAMALSAVVFAAFLLKRELTKPAESPGSLARPERVANWDVLIRSGISTGPATAPVTVVEFADLECPACKQFHDRLRKVAAAIPTDVRIVLIHFPLTTHRFAPAAAAALECASARGVAHQFMNVAYAKQDSFGLKSWPRYAYDAGVHDTTGFSECTATSAVTDRVARGRQLGDSMAVRGTPTLIINGWRFSDVPGEVALRDILVALKQGKRPPSA